MREVTYAMTYMATRRTRRIFFGTNVSRTQTTYRSRNNSSHKLSYNWAVGWSGFTAMLATIPKRYMKKKIHNHDISKACKNIITALADEVALREYEGIDMVDRLFKEVEAHGDGG
mgnify:CR=1 FL=1